MRLIPLLLLFCLALGAETVQIGSGALVNQSLPIEAARVYSYSQQLYLASEINFTGSINSLAFQYSVAGNIFLANNSAWKIWLGLADQDHLANWFPVDSLALVFNGVLLAQDFSGTLPGQGWLTVTLDEPFFYPGNRNLLVAVDENTPGSSSTSDEFLCTEADSVRGIVYASMTVNPDPAAPPASGFYARTAFANLRLDLTQFSYPPYQPVPADQATGVDAGSSLQWQSNSSTFDLYLGNSAQTMQLAGLGLTQTEWQPPEPLQLLETYYWQVVAHHAGLDYPGPVWSFTTIGEGIGPPQNLTGYYSGDHVQLNWQIPLQGTPHLYRVYRNGTFLATSANLGYQDFEVAPGENHYYQVRAENALGELSLPSNPVTVHIPGAIPDLILEEGFEACAPFTQVIPGWQNLDLDEAATWTWNNVDFPGEGCALGWLNFVPGQTTPPLTNVAAHSGAAMLASLSALTPPNNDWLISPSMQLGSQPELSFWARSHTGDYGLERLKVLISTTDDDPGSFLPLHTSAWLEVPVDWTLYSYDLSAWQGQNAYLAWQCVSWDAFALYLDDVVVTGEEGHVPLCEELHPALEFSVFPNPSQGEFALSNPAKTSFDFAIYDLRGRKVFSGNNLRVFRSADYSLDLASGIYLLRLESSGRSVGLRLAVIK